MSDDNPERPEESTEASGDQVPAEAGETAPETPEGPDPSQEPEEEKEPRKEFGEMSLMEHLQELRIRLTRMFLAAFLGAMGCYYFSQQLFDKLMDPLVAVMPPESTFIFTSLPEAFFTYVKVAAVAGVFATSPYLFYQLWLFVAPGLYPEERKWLIPIAFLSAVFFVTGASFGYFVVFPFGFEFFMSFATEEITPMPSLREYFGFSIKLLFAFGFIFEMPLFVLFLARLGVVTASMMRKVRKYAFLCSFVVAALLTPPDVISQLFMAGPLLVLYEISVIVAQVFGRKPRKAPDEEDEEEPGMTEGGEDGDDADEETASTKSS